MFETMKQSEVRIIEAIFKAASDYFGMDLLEKNRRREIVNARRAVIVWILREIKPTQTLLGMVTGKDHSTIIHALKTHENLLFSNDKVYSEVWQSFNRFMADQANLIIDGGIMVKLRSNDAVMMAMQLKAQGLLDKFIDSALRV